MPAESWGRVVDASALGALLFGEPEAEEVGRHLGYAVLLAPALLRFELASICRKKIRLHPEKRAALVEAHGLAEGMGIHEVDIRFDEVVRLAERTGLTVYDASYLWLARDLGLELVTLDQALASAARAER